MPPRSSYYVHGLPSAAPPAHIVCNCVTDAWASPVVTDNPKATAVSNVKGSALASRLLWVKLRKGHQGLAQVNAAASPGLQRIIARGAVLSTWYPFALFIELNELLEREFGDRDGSLYRLLGRHGADAHLTTIYRLFFKVGTVYWILGRGARLWSAYYDSGTLELYTRGSHRAEMRMFDFATPHKIHCANVAGWVERSVELSGGKNVVVNETSCRCDGAAHCQFVCSWQ